MSIQLFDPVGAPEIVRPRRKSAWKALAGMRVGYIFNQHTSALVFWDALEKAVERTLQPAAAQRVYKTNTWASAPKADVDRLVAQTDYVLVGVGA